jgi:hypothetical protein
LWWIVSFIDTAKKLSVAQSFWMELSYEASETGPKMAPIRCQRISCTIVTALHKEAAKEKDMTCGITAAVPAGRTIAAVF